MLFLLKTIFYFSIYSLNTGDGVDTQTTGKEYESFSLHEFQKNSKFSLGSNFNSD